MKREILLGIALAGIAGCSTNQSTKTVTSVPQGGQSTAPEVGALKQGTKVQARLEEEVSTRNHQVGDYVPATLTKQIEELHGEVFFPVGTKALLRITEIRTVLSAKDKSVVGFEVTAFKRGELIFYVGSVDRDSSASETGERGPSVDGYQILLGAGSEAFEGGLITGSVKGTVVPDTAGAAVGSEANQNRWDVVVPRRTRVDLELRQSMIVFAN